MPETGDSTALHAVRQPAEELYENHNRLKPTGQCCYPHTHPGGVLSLLCTALTFEIRMKFEVELGCVSLKLVSFPCFVIGLVLQGHNLLLMVS